MITSSSEEHLKEKVLSFVSARANIHHNLDDGFSFIAYLSNDKIIGGAVFSHYDGHNIWMHLALDDPLIMRRSFAKDVFEYCFIKCKCVRITAMTTPDNERCKKLIESAGFQQEGIIRKVIKKDMQYLDGVVYGLLRHECKYL